MRGNIVMLLSAREVRASVRSRWFLVGAVSFALLAVAVAQLGMAGAERWGVSTFDRTAAALLNLVLLFVPLLALPLGASSFAAETEDGTLPYLVAQPVTRGEVFAGKLAGLLVAMSMSLALGFGAAAIWIGLRSGVSMRTFAALAAGAWGLGIVTTVLGVMLSILSGSRARAFAAAIGVWLLLVFLCDFGILALAASQIFGPETLFGITVANPLQAAKTLTALSISQRLEILGPVGMHVVREIGRTGLAAILLATLCLWTLACWGLGLRFFRRENLT